MKKRKPKYKFVINFLIIFIVLIIVLYFSLKDNYEEIVNAIANMNYWYVILAIIVLCLYRALVSTAYYFVIKFNGEKVSYLRCLQINFIILFFHGVTPFAGGGQPMEVYYLHNEHIPITKATNITLQNFIVYQVALILVGTMVLIYNGFNSVFPDSNVINRLVALGFLVNCLVLAASFVLSFGKHLTKFISDKVIKFLAKIKIIKDEEKINAGFTKYLTTFHKNALELGKHKLTVVLAIMINILSLLTLYSIPYIVSKGLNIDISLISSIVATTYVMIIGSFVPIPGGTGGIEYGFVYFFGYFITGGVLHAVMLVWRFVTYYLGIIIGAVALTLYRKKEKIICE